MTICSGLLALTSLFWGCSPKPDGDFEPKKPLNVYIRCEGESMLPTLPVDHFALIDIGFPYTRLEVGDIVIFWDYRRGGYTLHRLVAKQGAFFIARGDNPETNKTADRAFVIPENYIGKFVGKY